MRVGRFDGLFLDNFLILLWYGLCVGVFVATFAATFPSATSTFKNLLGADQVAGGSVVVFLGVSALRLCWNKGLPLWTLPASYAATAVLYLGLISAGYVRRPSGNLWGAIAFPAFFLLGAAIGTMWLWNRIKPRRFRVNVKGKKRLPTKEK